MIQTLLTDQPTRFLRAHRLLLVATLWASSTSLVAAQLPSTQLRAIFPPGGKQGTTFEVKLKGNDLVDADRLVFSHPKITGKPKVATPEHFNTPHHVDNTFEVTIAADVPPGVYEARVAGRFGASNPRAFAVGRFDEVIATEGNHTAESAQVVEIGRTVSGVCDGSGIDYYKLTLKAGQRMLVDCFAERIDSRLDGTLVVSDDQGNQLSRSRDSVGLDPLIDFKAPSDGDYYIGVYDYLYRSGSDYFYRLSVHADAHVDFVFPPCGEPGSNGQYTVFGRNLPGGKPAEGMTIEGAPLEMLTVNIPLPKDDRSLQAITVGDHLRPQTTMLDGTVYRLGNSAPVHVGFARAPVILEAGDNDLPTKAQKVIVPCEFVGRFHPARDVDWIQFEAKKGEVFRLEAVSHRLGLETDPVIVIQKIIPKKEGGETVSEVATVDDSPNREKQIGGDFDTSTDDPEYRFVVPDDATYRIMIRDQFGDSRADARSVYRLIVRKEAPDFRLIAVPKGIAASNKNKNIVSLAPPVIPRGGSALVEVTIDGRDGFNSDVELSVQGLPSDITCPSITVSGSTKSAKLMLSAGENAAPWSGVIEVVGKATVDSRPIVRYARGGSIVWSTANRTQSPPVYRATRDMMVSVSTGPPLPATIQLGDTNALATCLGGKLEVPIRVQRRGDFKADLKITAEGLPKELKPKDMTVKGASAEARFELSLNSNNLKPGFYTCYLRAETKHKMVRDPDAAQRAQRDVDEVTAVLAALSDEIKKATADKVTDDVMKTLQDKKKRVDAAKKSIEKNAAEVKKANAAKDVNLSIVSTPIVFRVAASPFSLTTSAGSVSTAQDATVEIPVKLKKEFAFNDKVDLSIVLPSGVTGISAAKVSVDKDKDNAALQVKLAKTATVGDHTLTILATGKFNNVNVKAELPVNIKVEKKD